MITLIESYFALDKTILSVKAQTYACQHYIFINGERYYKNVSELVRKFENLKVIYLPNSPNHMRELISILVEEDIIFYLNEGVFESPSYIESHIASL